MGKKINLKRNLRGDLKNILKYISQKMPRIIPKTIPKTILTRNLKIGARINLVVFFLCFTALIIGILGLRTANQINQDLNRVYNNNLLMLKNLGEAQATFESQRVAIYEYILSEDESDKVQRQVNAINMMAKLEKSISLIAEGDFSDQDKSVLDTGKDKLGEYKKIVEKVFQVGAEDTADSSEVDHLALDIIRNEGAEAVSSINQTLLFLMATQVRLAEDTKQAADAQYEKTKSQMVIIIVCSIGIALALGMILSRSISKPIRSVAVHAGVIAGGDFTQAVPESYIKRKDEIGTLAVGFKNMQSQLNDLIRTIMGSAENIAAGTQQMSASTQQISGGAQEQSEQIRQVSENIQKVTATAKQVTERANSAWEVAHKAKETSQTGEAHIENVKNGMKTIDDTMGKLNDHSMKIGEIVNVISEIADQTNLLALNAAIEAARAGEHGRGFAVVAEEVRKLAERSGKATKEIVHIITTIQKDTVDAVKASRKGEKIAVEANQAFSAIHQLITGNADMVNEIVAAIQQVEVGLEQVSVAAETISAVTEEATAGVEEISASAEDMAGMADKLQTMVQNFRIV